MYYVEVWAIRVIQGMCTNAMSLVPINGQYSGEFGVGVVHQGYVLSPLFFTTVLKALCRSAQVYLGSSSMLMTWL